VKKLLGLIALLLVGIGMMVVAAKEELPDSVTIAGMLVTLSPFVIMTLSPEAENEGAHRWGCLSFITAIAVGFIAAGTRSAILGWVFLGLVLIGVLFLGISLHEDEKRRKQMIKEEEERINRNAAGAGEWG
jgi:hypothetical protein